LKLLIASDVAARGLDIPDVSHVFNYGPPPKDEDYIHRIGRTGRAGRTGESYTLIAPMDEKAWRGVMMLIKTEVSDFIPDGLADELETLPADEGRRGGRNREQSGRRGGRERGGRGRGGREETQAKSDAKKPDTPKREPETSPKQSDKPRSERPRRDYKRKDDDPILEPAPEDIKGFGKDVPGFLK